MRRPSLRVRGVFLRVLRSGVFAVCRRRWRVACVAWACRRFLSHVLSMVLSSALFLAALLLGLGAAFRVFSLP